LLVVLPIVVLPVDPASVLPRVVVPVNETFPLNEPPESAKSPAMSRTTTFSAGISHQIIGGLAKFILAVVPALFERTVSRDRVVPLDVYVPTPRSRSPVAGS
jgi:hypothetical protein